MSDRLARKPLPISQILLVLMGALLLYFLVDFGQQIRASQARQAELDQIEHKIAVAQEEQARLENDLVYARSDAAVEEWARKNGQTQPEEVPVVIVAPPADPATQIQPGGDRATDFATPREAWWDLFFGQH